MGYTYNTLETPKGRNLDDWTIVEKFNELEKLYLEFVNASPNSPRAHTIFLIEEIFSSIPIPSSKIEGNKGEILIEILGYKDDVYETIENDSYPNRYVGEKTDKACSSLRKLIEHFKYYSKF